MRKTLVLLALGVLTLAAQTSITPEKEAAMKADLAGQIDGMKKQAQVMVDSVFSFGELGFQEFETSKYLTGVLEKEGFKIERGIAGIPTAWVASWGSGQAGDLAGERYRRYSAGIAEARCGLARAADRRRAGPRRGPQFRRAAEYYGGAGGEEGDGARAPSGHDPALAGRGGGTGGHQGVLSCARACSRTWMSACSRTWRPTWAYRGGRR